MNLRNVLLLGLSTLVVVACASAPENTEIPSTTPDGLVRVENGPFELAFLRPGVNFSKYRRIQVRPISIEYAQTPDLTPMVQKRKRNYRLSDDQRARVSRAFAGSFTRAMTEGDRWTLTTNKGYDTLMVRVALANLSVHVPVKDRVLDSEFLVDEAAKVTLVVELRDSLTGETIARGRDTKTALLGSGAFRAGDQEELRRSVVNIFDGWTSVLREQLDILVEESRAPVRGP